MSENTKNSIISNPVMHPLDKFHADNISKFLKDDKGFNSFSFLQDIARNGEFSNFLDYVKSAVPEVNVSFHAITYDISQDDKHSDEPLCFHLATMVEWKGKKIMGPFFSSIALPLLMYKESSVYSMDERKQIIADSIQLLLDDKNLDLDAAIIHNPHKQFYAEIPESPEQDKYVTTSPTTQIFTKYLAGVPNVTGHSNDSQRVSQHYDSKIVGGDPHLFNLFNDSLCPEEQMELFNVSARVIEAIEEFHAQMPAYTHEKPLDEKFREINTRLSYAL